MTRRASRGQDYPAFPRIWAKIGENPARFLTETNDLNPAPRIRGIHDEDVLECWLEVELDLGPRKRIMALLNQQRQYLREADDGQTVAEFFEEGTPSPSAEPSQAVATDGGERE